MVQIHPNAAGFRARRFFLHLLAGAPPCRAPAHFGRAASPFAAVFRRGTESAPYPALTHRRYSACLLLLTLTFVHQLLAQKSSEPAPQAAHALLLDIVNTGDKLVAVGDYGHVVISRDHGQTWTQSLTPTRALLTGVSFPDARHGWAVGHDGVIISTSDGGQTWQHQDDGKEPDTVFLDVLFLDTQRGFVVGAYGKFFMTVDGGRTWTGAKPSADDLHFNRISVGADGYLYLAGESGTLLVSIDGAKNWRKADVPYDGSLFGVLPLDGGSIITYGLRGHILRSGDHGANWEPENSAIKVLIMGGIRLQNGAIVLGGQGGNFFVSRDAGRTFRDWKPEGFGTSVADLVETADGWLVTVGEAGAVRIKLP